LALLILCLFCSLAGSCEYFNLSLDQAAEHAPDSNPPVTPPPPGTTVAKRGTITYESLWEALEAARLDHSGAPVDEITLVQSILLPEPGAPTTPVNYTGGYPIGATHTRLKAEPGASLKIQRKSGADEFTGSLFIVNSSSAELNLGSGTGDGSELIIDGNKDNVTAASPLVNVSSGTLNIGIGAILQNNHNTGDGGAIHNTGNINIDGGTIRNNLSGYQGGGIDTWSGTITMNSGTIADNAITNTSAGRGGQVNLGSGSFTMTGGTIGGTAVPSADNAHEGGGVYANGAFSMSGGEIRNNSAVSGKGVYYAGGNFTITGSAKINTNNDVYLGLFGSLVNSIKIPGPISTAYPVAIVTPADYTTGTVLLALAGGTTADLSDGAAKMRVTSNGGNTYYIDADGKLADAAILGEGSISITFSGLPQDEATNLTGIPGSALSWAAGTLNVTVPTANFPGAGYLWYKDGMALADNGTTITGATAAALQISAKEFSLTTHELTVKITTASSVVYSKTLTFEVE
jgi:hypothetical protein